MGSASLAAARQAARPPGPWRQFDNTPPALSWGLRGKNVFQIGIVHWVVMTNHQMPLWKKIHSVRIDLLKNCSHAAAWWVPLRRPTKLGSHTRGGTVLGLVRALSRHVRRFGSFTKILEDCRMMRIVCIARRWKQRLFFFYNFHCVYIQTIIHLFIFIIITIASISVNMWQNSSGCCCLWSGKAWVKHATGLFFSQSWSILLK